MSANLNKSIIMYERNIAIYNHLPKQSSREVGGIMVSSENAAELSVENVFHLYSALGDGEKEQESIA